MERYFVLTENCAIEIGELDLPEMTFEDARNYCLTIGDRWRLPTEEEHNVMYTLHKKAIGKFQYKGYWSSEGFNNREAKFKSYSTGGYYTSKISKSSEDFPKKIVRLVRNI